MALTSTEIATAFVGVNVKLREFEVQMKNAENAFKQSINRMDKEGEKGFSFLKMLGASISGQAIYAGITNALGGVASGISGLAKEMVAGNAEMEGYEMAFSTLLGSMDAAKARMAELVQFAAKTPFQIPEVVRASRLLQTFGGTALATGKNLELVGDMASQAQKPFEEVAFWVGRMYTGLKAGAPVGEALMRLQELALLSGETRREMETMQKAGANGREIWEKFLSGFKGGGMMEKQSHTFGGLMSNFQDALDTAKRTIGKPLFDVAKEGLEKVMDFMSSPRWNEMTETLAQDLKDFIGFVKSLFGDIDAKGLGEKIASGLEYIGVLFRNFKNVAKVTLLSIPIAAMDMFPHLEGVINGLVPLWSGVCAFMTSAFENVINVITAMFTDLVPTLKKLFDRIFPSPEEMALRAQMMFKAMTGGDTSEFEGALEVLRKAEEGKRFAEDKKEEALRRKRGDKSNTQKAIDEMKNPFDEFQKAFDAKMGIIEEAGGSNAWFKELRKTAQAEIDKLEKELKDSREQNKPPNPEAEGAGGDETFLDFKGKNKKKDKKDKGWELVGIAEMANKVQTDLGKKDKNAEETAKNTKATADNTKISSDRLDDIAGKFEDGIHGTTIE